MNIQVKDVNFNAEDELLDFGSKKAEKLYQIYDHITNVEVIYRQENNHELDNKTAEILVRVPGNELFAKKTTKSFEESTDQVVEALRKQISKYKEKLSEH